MRMATKRVVSANITAQISAIRNSGSESNITTSSPGCSNISENAPHVYKLDQILAKGHESKEHGYEPDHDSCRQNDEDWNRNIHDDFLLNV